MCACVREKRENHTSNEEQEGRDEEKQCRRHSSSSSSSSGGCSSSSSTAALFGVCVRMCVFCVVCVPVCLTLLLLILPPFPLSFSWLGRARVSFYKVPVFPSSAIREKRRRERRKRRERRRGGRRRRRLWVFFSRSVLQLCVLICGTCHRERVEKKGGAFVGGVEVVIFIHVWARVWEGSSSSNSNCSGKRG